MSEHENYKSFAGEVNTLRSDLSKTAHASKFMASANKSAIDENKRRHDALEARLRHIEGRLPTLDLRVSTMETGHADTTGKIRVMEIAEAKDEKVVALAKTSTERDGKRWALYGTIAVALVTGVANLVLHFFGG